MLELSNCTIRETILTHTMLLLQFTMFQLPDKEPQELPASAVGSQTTVEQQDDKKDDNLTDDSAAATPAIESRDSRSLAASKQQQAQEKKPEKKYLNDITD